jgi:hypothetical protein
MTHLAQKLCDLWIALTRQKQSSGQNTLPEVFLHDPAAQRPHDLDDPYFDPKVQSRMAEVISKNAAKRD